MGTDADYILTISINVVYHTYYVPEKYIASVEIVDRILLYANGLFIIFDTQQS
jgi:hypothetical protein